MVLLWYNNNIHLLYDFDKDFCFNKPLIGITLVLIGMPSYLYLVKITLVLF